MRRSRFASAIATAEVRQEISLGDAVTFDIRAPQTGGEESLADWRVKSLEHAPVLLGATHLLIALTCILSSASHSYGSLGDNPFIPSALVTMLDIATAVLVLSRQKVGLGPHNVVRILCGYIALSTILWSWFGYTVSDDLFRVPFAAAPIAMAAGIAMGTIVSVSSPPLALVNMICSQARHSSRSASASCRWGCSPTASPTRATS